jgi:hypothetical protein
MDLCPVGRHARLSSGRGDDIRPLLHWGHGARALLRGDGGRANEHRKQHETTHEISLA